jgi:CheY-like chemotaxis protein
MLKELLNSSETNYEVTAVETAAEGLMIDGRSPFDLYILDMWLPGMDGMALCRRLRDRGRTAPIIFYSAMVQPADRDYCLAAGADEFLTKPKDLEKLPETVARLLNGTGRAQSE